MHAYRIAALVIAAGLSAAPFAATARAEIKLPPVISSNMILQRDMPAPVWGTAAPGEEVTVTFAGQTKSAKADDQGKWMVKLDALKVSTEPQVLVIASSAAPTNDPPVTLTNVLVGEVWIGSGQSNMDMPVTAYTKGDPVLATNAAIAYPHLRILRSGWKGWEPSTSNSNARCSALLFSFGVPLQKELNVPVGLIVGAVGGTPSGYWLTEDMYRSDPACKAAAAKAAETFKLQAQRQYTNALAQWELAAAKAGTNPPAKPVLAPPPPESKGKIGNLFESHIRCFVPFAIRGVLWDQGESGTAINGVDQYTVMGALIRGWRQLWGEGDFPFIYVQKPSGGGCAWEPADPVTRCAESFKALPPAPPSDGGERELHIRIMQHPRTAMAISSDLGPGIHPVCKSGYGARAARVALGFAYARPVEYYGPVYQSHTVENGKVRIRFTHVGQGLAFRGGDKLQGFALAGANHNFQWADAVIDGDCVVLSSDKVISPEAIRYAWSRNHTWANLFNKDGLPALPFRTDRTIDK